MIPPGPGQSAEQVEAAYFRVASRIRYRLQLFNPVVLSLIDFGLKSRWPAARVFAAAAAIGQQKDPFCHTQTR